MRKFSECEEVRKPNQYLREQEDAFRESEKVGESSFKLLDSEDPVIFLI